MGWEKRGLVYCPDGSLSWAIHSALTPTPILLGNTIRVYAGLRDEFGVSRIGFVDLDANCPNRILRISKKPALDIGEPGEFDDNGVILGDVVNTGAFIRMYYVGFQQVARVKFLAFSGLAISHDGGETFHRKCQVPVLERSDEGRYIRAIHTALQDNGVWRIWYAAGNGWESINGTPYPQYATYYAESPDGLQFPRAGSLCLAPRQDEYRLGRPRVYRLENGYEMLFTWGSRNGQYLPGYAYSIDGINWERRDTDFDFSLSITGWDSRHLCYPSLIRYRERRYLFYNGNDMGKDGFGYAEFIKRD